MLPFAALVRKITGVSEHRDRDWEYLVEWKPLHVALSGTVYAEIRKQQESRKKSEGGLTLVAFGDPKYPMMNNEQNPQNAPLRSIDERGFKLVPLPATRKEVMAIGNLFGKKSQVFVGDAATEERAKAIGKDTRYIHFASHGLLDKQFPLNSALALTIPAELEEGRENGLLQAWEILERVRINADLVVLSACQTGLGKEMGGEGLVGLTRAFQYAGASSVLASLWSIADETTSEFMKRFYGYLKSGKTKDEALRAAQIDFLRGSAQFHDEEGGIQIDASPPFFWAAFQLNGNWK